MENTPLTHPELQQAVAAINQAIEVGATLDDAGLAASQVGMQAIEAAYNSAAVEVASIDTAELALELVSFTDSTAAIERLTDLRSLMVAENLETDEVDRRIAEAQPDPDSDYHKLAGFILTRSLGNFFIGNRQPAFKIISTSVEPTLDKSTRSLQPDIADIEEDKQEPPIIPIRILVDDSQGYLQFGNSKRRIPLSGARYTGQRNYAPERFAAVVVLSELTQGEQVSVAELWERMHSQVLNHQTLPGFDRHVMTSIRNFLVNLRYRSQPVFQHNGTRGPSSAYSLNPELRYDIEIDAISDDHITTIARTLQSQANRHNHQPGIEMPETVTGIVAPQIEELPTTTDVPAEDLYKSEYERHLKDSGLLPTPHNLHSFLLKVDSTMSVIFKQIEDDSSMLARLYDVTEEMLDTIESNGYKLEEQGVRAPSDETVEAMRSEVVEQFIQITQNDALLNQLLEDEGGAALKNIYGKQLGNLIIALIETVLDMDEPERDLLREIIVAKDISSIRMKQDGYHGVPTVMDTDHIVILPRRGQFQRRPETPLRYPQAQIEEELEGSPRTPHITDTPVIAAPKPEEKTAQPATETSAATRESGTHLPTDQDADVPVISMATLEPRERLSRSRQIQARFRQIVGTRIESMITNRLKPTDRLTTNRMEAVFKTPRSFVVNAHENGWIDRNRRDSLSMQDAITVLILNDSDPEVAKLFNSPKNRKLFKKVVKECVQAWELSKGN